MRILLVDDHGLVREGVALLLRSLDPRIGVHQTADIHDALDAMGTHGPFDIVLLDLEMPGMRELDSLHLFRGRFPEQAVVVLSANEDPNTVRRAIDDGAMGYVKKSLDPATMMQALRVVLDDGIYVPPVCLEPARGDDPSPADRLASLRLSPRQEEVLLRLAHGKSNKAIARELNISDTTVKSHLKVVFEILDVHSRTQAMYELSRLGWRAAEPG